MSNKSPKINLESETPVLFSRDVAFSRTVGLVTKAELEVLKNKTVAIAGLGGVGGSHVQTLVRLGIGGINIADMDIFGVENFNRQAGANMNSVGQEKVKVTEQIAKSINPEIRIQTFPSGVNKENINDFFAGVDAFIDGLDFFAFAARQMVFRFCQQKNIPAVTVGPIGMGAAMMSFIPGGMSFDDYFQWKDSDSELDLAIKFLLGLTPKAPHRSYVVEPSAVNLKEKKGPSTPMACEMAAGFAGTEVLKILLNRGRVYSAPHSIVYDAYHSRLFHSFTPWGNRNPIQLIKLAIARRIIAQEPKSK